MPTAVRVRNVKLQLDYPFMYLISSLPELHDYWNDVERPRWSRALVEGALTKNHHPTSPEGTLIEQLSLMRSERPIVTMQRAMEDKFLALERSLNDGPILINSNGGFFGLSPFIDILERQEVSTWALPGAKIKIVRWPGGDHFYAYIGTQSVEEGGQNKWFSEKVARINAERFAKRNNIQLEEEQ